MSTIIIIIIKKKMVDSNAWVHYFDLSSDSQIGITSGIRDYHC